MMDATLAQLIKDVLTDAIKILGPAIIAALVSYHMARAQIKQKLAELEKTYEYGAKEHYFIYYKERQRQLEDDYKKLSADLGGFLGTAAGFTSAGEREDATFINTFTEFVLLYLRIAPKEIQITLRDMEKQKLSTLQEYSQLKEFLETLATTEQEPTYQALKNNVLKLLETYHYLQHCNQLLMSTQLESVFSKYAPSQPRA